MDILKQSSGSILLETLISIVLLALIVIGSFYSYSIFQKRILAQRQQRIALSMVQGWMEQAMLSLMDPNSQCDPNNPNDTAKKENELWEQFKTEMKQFNTKNFSGLDPDTDIDRPKLGLNDNMITIGIGITLNDLPINLYTEINRAK